MAPESLSPRRRTRVLIAFGVGLFGAAAAWIASHRPGFGVPDFHTWWLAARAVIEGENPYLVVPAAIGEEFQFFNPLPAAILAVPFAVLRPDVALALFSGLSASVLAYVVTRRSYDPLVMFLSASFAHAAVMGQWSMLLTAALCAPALSVVGAAKPNIGIAIVAALASWRALEAVDGHRSSPRAADADASLQPQVRAAYSRTVRKQETR